MTCPSRLDENSLHPEYELFAFFGLSRLKPVVDHIHSLGLKAGIYSDAGANTCGSFWDNDTIARNVGLLGHEINDCQLFFNNLGFDFIKVNYCGADGNQNKQLYDVIAAPDWV